LKKFASPAVAFGVPGVLMAIALAIFIAGTKKYKIKKPSDNKNTVSEPFLEQLKQVWKVLVVFSFIPIFWALYDQNGSEWVIQSGKMDLHFMGVDWLQEQIQTVNALLILILIPVFSFGVYPWLEKRGIKITALRKFGWGLALTAFSFVVIALIQVKIDAGEKPNIAWQLLAYLILTVGEILVSITGLEYSFSQAPKSMKSTIMAIFFFTVFLGNILVVYINKNIQSGGFFSHYSGADYFWLFAGIMAVNTVLFYLAVWAFKIKDTTTETQLQDDLHA
jgi:POT family proton-dependent oligopeptide transporter